ncbi:hypothetical protein TPHA_0F00140 [Tetrapisispora phaffii CBS 4417]|uniref:SET domain-containing protein n=1 Tax=Tetrapisispora phaffii (strain ATCC 24235 / CBS 4417 / NBRC 1672 / NRRL Y-8282 / UCD 70-5) TaxID=1071381 RepID=G8BUR9_TETPH|nr:hypothetical protein TPHA_0F00140 [Tetrapisispora phaffii CBS 4417]CCE63501.1 hypothetical protein TPHA_0F00140 [Tetrapisispora phaffii CBS 4417]
MNDEKLSSLLNWAKENGAIIDDRIGFKYNTNSGFSCFAKNDIKSEEKPLIEIPKNLLITHSLAESHFNTKITEIKLTSKNSNALTQLYLSKLKFSNSNDEEVLHLKPYLDILPSDLEQPYFWGSKLLQLVHQTDLYLILKEIIVKIYNEWIELKEQLNVEQREDEDKNLKGSSADQLLEYLRTYNSNEIKWESFYAYTWATCIFKSRAFPNLVIDDKNVIDINLAFLYPVVDLLNHKNDTRVKWSYNENKVQFVSEEKINVDMELFNNYGNKSNEELLLNYGFIEENNVHDNTRLTLRLETAALVGAQNSGVKFSKEELVKSDCVQFLIDNNGEVPKSLINLFGYLCKLKSEEFTNIRSVLEGIDQLNTILTQKIELFKSISKARSEGFGSSEVKTVQSIKKFANSQKMIYNRAFDNLLKLQKTILKSAKETLSFRSAYKSDQLFSNSLLLTWGITNYEDLKKNDNFREAVLMWMVRISNQNNYKNKFKFNPPKFIFDCFKEKSKSIVIEKEDVAEFLPFHKKLFPALSQKIPEVYGQGDWGIKQFIIASSVYDMLVWTKDITQEPLFIKNEKYLL